MVLMTLKRRGERRVSVWVGVCVGERERRREGERERGREGEENAMVLMTLTPSSPPQ
jgi:hypothetical protein